MYLNYFIYDGRKYYTGTVVKIKSGMYDRGAFICHNLQNDTLVFQVGGGRMHLPREAFLRKDVQITGEINKNVHMPVQKTFKDSDIEGLSLGWVWYIFLMAICTLFKGNIFYWIVISVLFFAYRKKVRKEKGTYYEW